MSEAAEREVLRAARRYAFAVRCREARTLHPAYPDERTSRRELLAAAYAAYPEGPP